MPSRTGGCVFGNRDEIHSICRGKARFICFALFAAEIKGGQSR